MTILFDAHPLLGNKTGVGYYTEQLIRSLAKEHPDVQFIGYYHNFLWRKHVPNLPEAPNIRYRRITLIPGQVVNLLRRLHIYVPIEALTLTRPNFILYPNFLGHASLFSTPSACVIHDLTFVDLPEYVSARNLHDLRTFIPLQIRRSSFIITVSEFSKQRILEEFGADPSTVVVTPIPPQAAEPDSAKHDKKTLADLGIPGKYILTLGTVEPRKNLLTMLYAFTMLPTELQSEYAFVIAGKIGWNCEAETSKLQELKDRGANIIHIGYVTDEQRKALYRQASIFTSASVYEGFGMPVLEAMSYGLPCAISDIPVYHEIAGTSALFFQPTSPADIQRAWASLIEDPVKASVLAASGKKYADSMSWRTVSRSLYGRIQREIDRK